MKKINLIFLFVIATTLFSCSDAYDIKQDGEFLEENTFRSVADMQLFLNEVYDRASIQSEIGFSGYATDELGFGSQNAGQNRDVMGYIINSNDGSADGIWLTHYTLINFANRLLRGAALVTPAASEVAEYNSIVAQARALRAFGHFQLLTYFSTDLKNDNALGVILMDRVPDIFEKLPRSTNGEVFTLIEADLQFAYDNVLNNQASRPWTYISKNFVNALRARMYAYRGNYTLASQYATDVITSMNGAGISLTAATPVVPGSVTAAINSATWNNNFYGTASITPVNPYRRMWMDIDRGEVIFSLDRSVGKGAVAGLYYFNRTNLTGGPFHDMGRNLFNLLDSEAGNPLAAGTPGDIRRLAFIDPTSKVDHPFILPNSGSTGTAGSGDNYTLDGSYQANDALLIDKYPGKSGFDLGNDLKVFRLSEMYFIRAEAYVAAGNLTSAAQEIKTVRDARNRLGAQPLPVYANATAAWADILKERRLELCFEGHRYIDLKRLGALAGAGIDRYTRDCELVNTCSIPLTDHRFTMPIPIGEVNANNNIQQNPGY